MSANKNGDFNNLFFDTLVNSIFNEHYNNTFTWFITVVFFVVVIKPLF